jgi:hypothetical protein
MRFIHVHSCRCTIHATRDLPPLRPVAHSARLRREFTPPRHCVLPQAVRAPPHVKNPPRSSLCPYHPPQSPMAVDCIPRVSCPSCATATRFRVLRRCASPHTSLRRRRRVKALLKCSVGAGYVAGGPVGVHVSPRCYPCGRAGSYSECVRADHGVGEGEENSGLGVGRMRRMSVMGRGWRVGGLRSPVRVGARGERVRE